MSVSELLKKKRKGVVTVEATADVARAVDLMMSRGIGGVPVVDAGGALVGFVSEREVVDAVDRNRLEAPRLAVTSIMRRPAPTCRADDSIRAVMERMTDERLRHLVVMDGAEIAGVISVGDLVKHRLSELETEAGVLRDYVAAQRAMR